MTHHIYTAIKEKLMLITDDKKPREIASKYLKVSSSIEIIK